MEKSPYLPRENSSKLTPTPSMLQVVTLSDIKSLQTICHAAYTEHFGSHWEEGGLAIYLENEFNLDRIRQDIANPAKAYYFILEGEERVGFIKMDFGAQLDSFPESSCSELEKIYILPGQAGKGTGKKAVREIINICHEKQMKAIFLYVIDTNQAAIHFYSRLGFQKNGTGRLDTALFKEALRGMHRMILAL